MTEHENGAETTRGPKGLMLVPRSAGGSLVDALRGALPEDALTVVRGGDVETAGLPTGHCVVAGDLPLDTFDGVVAPEALATVLREPASRVLSLYAALRSPADGRPGALAAAARQPLHDFLADPRAAVAADNRVARMVLPGDGRLPADGFLDPADAEAVAADAIARLETLGCVALLELPEDAAARLGAFAGVDLSLAAPAPEAAADEDAVPFAPLTAEALALLDDRCAADAIVYDHFLLPRVDGEDAARSVAEVALVRQLVRFGDAGGHAAARALRADAARADAEAARDQAQSALAAAESVRDEARAAVSVLEGERDAARSAVAAAERERDAARDALAAAEAERDAAQAAVAAAERERDGARDAVVVAETERDAARAERDDVPAAPADAGSDAADDAIATAHGERDAAQAELAAARAELERLRAAAAAGTEIERRHVAQEAELAALRARLAEATGTATWQVTAPLRAVEGRLGRFLGR